MGYEGENVFDAAYADVVWTINGESNWGYTQMLLTWTLVAMVWSHEAQMFYQIFGVFGAMSGAFFVYVPPKAPKGKIPASYWVCAVAGFVCIWLLSTTKELPELKFWLYGLHAALLVPKILPIGPELELSSVLVGLGGLCLLTHVTASAATIPSTDCRLSITIDLAAVSVITVCFIRSSGASLLLTLLASLACWFLSPGCVLALAGAW